MAEERRGEIADLVRRMGPVGAWCPQLQWQPAAAERVAVGAIEDLGFGAVWVGEATGKEILTHCSLLLAGDGGGGRIAVATGIASIWARDPMAMANAGRTLNEAYPGRFLMGLGVSHPFLTEQRERTYATPLAEMRSYLDAMDRAPYAGPAAEPAPRVLAALGPKMLELAAERTAGAHPYFVPVDHTAEARRVLGAGPFLAPEQAAVFETDPDAARTIARRYTATYLKLTSYASNLRRLGWGDEDLAGDGSDRLVDALVAWGGLEAVAGRVREHLEAGADHVAVRVLTEDPKRLPLAELRELASALPSLSRRGPLG
jgi:probable F420-dependent oxidoreductase